MVTERRKMEKSNVVKSKSSNSAITTKSDNHSSNKKSRSSAEFQRHGLKKRGVYVEKKSTNVSIHKAGNLQDKPVVKPPPRPKPGQKRFLASVLTILSKSTAGTQFPEKGTKPRKTKIRRKVNAQQSPNLDIKTAPKYRSKVLNDEMFKNLDQDKSLVLQYKNINNCTSNYSESSYRTREYSPKSGNFLRSDIGSIMSSEAKGVVQQVLEGLQIKNRDVRIQEPVTQVEKTKTSKSGENDEQLYKFFVDLLETTFSVYNVKPEYDAARIESTGSSKVAFEIDESVVKKLERRRSSEDDLTQPNFYCVKDTDIAGGKNAVSGACKRPKEILPLKQAKPKVKRKLKSQSFIYSTKTNKKSTNPSNALLFPKKSFSKKAKKKTLINLFKEQLSMSYSDFQEPQTLYEALRVMARNKRKYQKAIRFDVPPTNECVFRRPKVISSKKPRKAMKYDDDFTFKSCESPKCNFHEKADYMKPLEKFSHHTLEVYGFDYEDDDIVKPTASVEREVLLNQQSFTSEEDFGFDFEPLRNDYKFTRDQIGMFDK